MNEDSVRTGKCIILFTSCDGMFPEKYKLPEYFLERRGRWEEKGNRRTDMPFPWM
jgi:hypothetical protein